MELGATSGGDVRNFDAEIHVWGRRWYNVVYEILLKPTSWQWSSEQTMNRSHRKAFRCELLLSLCPAQQMPLGTWGQLGGQSKVRNFEAAADATGELGATWGGKVRNFEAAADATGELGATCGGQSS